MATQRPQTRALAASRRRGAALGVGVDVRLDVPMADTWRLIADIPAEGLVSVRRRGGSRLVKMSIGIPALHNVHDRSRAHAVKKTQQAALDAELWRDQYQGQLSQGARERRSRIDAIQASLAAGQRIDALIIRRAPRPLDAAIQVGEWKRGGRQLYGDNTSSSLKTARDWLAKRVFGLDGDSSSLLRWHVGQERSGAPRQYQIEVLIKPATDCECCGLPRLPGRWLRGEL